MIEHDRKMLRSAYKLIFNSEVIFKKRIFQTRLLFLIPRPRFIQFCSRFRLKINMVSHIFLQVWPLLLLLESFFSLEKHKIKTSTSRTIPTQTKQIVRIYADSKNPHLSAQSAPSASQLSTNYQSILLEKYITVPRITNSPRLPISKA